MATRTTMTHDCARRNAVSRSVLGGAIGLLFGGPLGLLAGIAWGAGTGYMDGRRMDKDLAGALPECPDEIEEALREARNQGYRSGIIEQEASKDFSPLTMLMFGGSTRRITRWDDEP